MSDKKNIDRLFQEKFKDFDVTPDESVWEKIKARKDNDRKRAFILPLWYKVGGVAAVAAILIAIGYFSLTKSTDPVNPTLVESETKETPSNPIDSITNHSNPNTTVVSSEQNDKNSSESKTPQEDEALTSSPNTIATPQKRKAVDSKPLKENRYTTPKGSSYSQTQNAIAEQVSDQKTNTTISEKEASSSTPQKDPTKATTVIAENQSTDSKTTDQESHLKSIDSDREQDAKRIADNNSIQKDGDNSEQLTTEDITSEEPIKKSIFDAIVENEEEDIEATEESGKKWTVAPNIAPVYYNSVGNGSSIDRQFADNEKSGQVNLSYGVQVAYEINKRFSIRSGVHKVDLSYNTLDVGFSPSATGQNISSIDYAPSAQAILVSDLGTQNIPSFNGTEVSRDAINQRQNEGLLNQGDWNKNVLGGKKKEKLINGGGGGRRLLGNKISLEAGDFETEIGQANNLNDVSFSGNIGIGIDYKLSDQFQINLEPIFKYQFNAFNDAGDFRPFYFGVYTGMSIKF